MTEKLSPQIGNLTDGARRNLLSLTSTPQDRTELSSRCLVYDIGQIEAAKQDVLRIQAIVNHFDGTPGAENIYGRYYGDNQIIRFWKGHVGNAVSNAINQINRENARENLPMLPTFDQV